VVREKATTVWFEVSRVDHSNGQAPAA
jgi:hypothetical protein